MIWVDWCILAVIALSIGVGAFRGFTRELLGLGSWVLAFFVSWAFADLVAERYLASFAVPSLRLAGAYGLLFFAGLVAGALITALVSRLVRGSPLAVADRIVGGGFGLARGLLVVGLFILMAGMTAARKDPWWERSLLIARLEWLAAGLGHLLPADLAGQAREKVETAAGAPA